MNQDAEPPTGDIGRRDAETDGAFNHATGELRPGFGITRDDVVLDVGCGAGRESVFCGQRGAHVIFVDIDPAEVARTRDALAGTPARGLTPIVSDTNPLPLPDGIASKVIAAEVIEHVDDPAQFLSELVRAGRPGAHYLLAVPDPGIEKLQVGLAADSYHRKPNHVRVIDRDAFARMATDAGLIVERRGYYGFYSAIWFMFFWLCRVDLAAAARHPLIQLWDRTWNTLLDTPGNARLRRALNEILPMSQYIIARKPRADERMSPGTLRRVASFFGLGTRPGGHGPISAPADGAAPATSLLTHPRPNEFLDSAFIGVQDAAQSGWFDMGRREIFTGFPILPDDIVLDVGCGSGNYTEQCARWAAHVIFSDVDPASVAETERRLAGITTCNLTPIVGSADPLPVADDSVTRVISLEVLEHVDDPRQFLKELVRVGKRGALYLLSVPDPLQESLQHELAPPEFFLKGQGLIRGLSSGHLRTIGRNEFEQLVIEAGLEIQSHHYAGFFRALWLGFFWLCDVDFANPDHPLLNNWTRTWKFILDAEDGMRVKSRLDAFMPKSQTIVARKP